MKQNKKELINKKRLERLNTAVSHATNMEYATISVKVDDLEFLLKSFQKQETK